MEILDYLFRKAQPPVDESDLPTESSILQDYEALVALLTYPSWEGEPRALSELKIRYDSPEWVAGLSDVQNRRSATGRGKTVVAAIEDLNRNLLTRECRWYSWDRNPTQGGNGKSSISLPRSARAAKPRGKSK